MLWKFSENPYFYTHLAIFRRLRLSAPGLIPRAVKFFPEQRQFRFFSHVFRCQDFFLSASLRLCERQNILSRRRGGAEIRAQSSLIFKLPELSAGDCL
ncbi:MAG: hypothetical protein DRI57_26070 [Deltaproteobacteria bacterium]|nr:MAG: hypothetical protein DRI57_26070 [Deltaproteobacteria bacterium]